MQRNVLVENVFINTFIRNKAAFKWDGHQIKTEIKILSLKEKTITKQKNIFCLHALNDHVTAWRASKPTVRLNSHFINHAELHWGYITDSERAAEAMCPPLSSNELPCNAVVLGCWPSNQTGGMQCPLICFRLWQNMFFFLKSVFCNVFVTRFFRLLRSWPTLTWFWSTGLQWRRTTLPTGTWFWPGQSLWQDQSFAGLKPQLWKDAI